MKRDSEIGLIIPLRVIARLLRIAHMHNQRIEIGATFCGINLRHSLRRIGPRGEAINRLCRHSDDAAAFQNRCCPRDPCVIGQ